MSRWIQRGDEVIVVAGNDKGKVGKVLARGRNSVIVEGVNRCKKAMKKSQDHQQGGFVSFEKPVDISNVALCLGGKKVKVKVRAGKDGKRELVYIELDEEKVLRKIKK